MLAAGTSTGGVLFGRALIEALLKRAERHTSAKEHSQRVRKISFALALGCLENLRQQDATLKTRVLSHLSELVPPRNNGDARILSVAGDAAVPLLQYATWKDDSTATVAACAQALRLIGTTQAIRSLRNGYTSDHREQVAAEVLKTGTIEPEEVPLVAAHVEKTGKLPHYAQISTIGQVTSIRGLKEFSINPPFPDDASRLAELDQLVTLEVESVPLEDVSKLNFPPALRELRIMGCSGTQLDWLSKLNQLRRLWLFHLGDVRDLSALNSLQSLESLLLFAPGVMDLHPLTSLSSLESLMLINCKKLNDLSPLQNVQKLSILHMESCPKIQDLSILSAVETLTALNLESCAQADIQSIEALPNLTSITILDHHNLRSLGNLKRFPLLNKVVLGDCRHLGDVSPLAEISELTSLTVRGCIKLSEMPSLAQTKLRELTVGSLNIGEIQIGEGTYLETLNLQNLTRLERLPSLAHGRALRDLSLIALNVTSLGPLSGHPTVEHLTLSHCPRFESLDSLRGMSNLKELYLSGCEDVVELDALAQCENIERIVLSRCPKISNLAPLSRISSIKKIELFGYDMKRMTIPAELLPLIVSHDLSGYWLDPRQHYLYAPHIRSRRYRSVP